jgi:Putative phage tail protein
MGWGSSGSSGNQWPKYTGVQLNVAVNTMPVPILWGSGKLGTNLIEYTDFKGKKTSQGGKGGGKSSGTDYKATLQLGVCEGILDSVPLVLVNTNNQQTLSQLSFSLIQGAYPDQDPWDYMVTAHPGAARPYPGTAMVVGTNVDLGEGAAAPNYNMLCIRESLNAANDNHFKASWCNPNHIQTTTYPKLRTAFPSGIPTADMALVIQDFLTNAQYGVQCFPSSCLDTSWLLSSSSATTTGDGALQTYLRALGIGMCPCLDSQETAQSILGRWAQLCNFATVWGTNAGGMALKCVPYGDESITANGVTYLPNLSVVYSFDDDDYLGDSSEDPIAGTITDFIDAFNVVRVEVSSDDGFFSGLPVEARDQNAIEKAGAPRIMPTVTAHEIVGIEVGAIVAQLILQQGLYWRNTYQFKLASTFCLLEPMDMIALTDANLGLNATPCRVTEIEEDEKGELSVTVQEFRQGVSTAVLYDKSTSGGTIPDLGAAASNVNTPVVLEPSNALVSEAQVWLTVCGGNTSGTDAYDPNWGGCQVWISLDNDNYELAGTIDGPNRMGHLTANLAAYSGGNPDTTDTLYVDLSESEGDLATGTISSSGTLNLPLCYVVNYNAGTGVWSGGELLYYETATLVSQTASNETHDVPSAAPFTVLVDNATSFLSDGGVSAANPFFPLIYLPMTYTSGTPASGQYTVSDGLYVFNAAQAGYLLRITYDYGNPYHYALTGLYRGQFGTTGDVHASGDLFARLDNSIFEYDLPTQYVGVPIYIKFVSFNIYGNGLEDISTVSPYLYTPTGAGIPPNQTAGGNYTVTSGDVTAGQSTIPTGLAAIASESVTIKRSGSVVTSNATIATSGSDILVASGPSGTGSYVLTAGDVIVWLAVA